MRLSTLLFLCCLTTLISPTFAQQHFVDFSKAQIVVFQSKDRLAAQSLQDVVFKRTGCNLRVKDGRTKEINDATEIVLLTKDQLEKIDTKNKQQRKEQSPLKKEGYTVFSDPDDQRLWIIGNDKRGALYGVGYLLRKSKFEKGKFSIPRNLNKTSSPAYPIRGHQMAYRPKTNAYDAWTVDQYRTYIRDLTLFGLNSIEIVPPRTDDDLTGPNMKLPPAEMMVEQSKIAQDYDLDVWIWYPNMGSDYVNPDSIKKELIERDSIFQRLPRLDDVFVPAGDPGSLHPDILFDWLEKEAKVLRRYHPDAKIWVSPQQSKNPSDEWFGAFYKRVNEGHDWLGGIVYGPWIKGSIQEVREKVDKSLPLLRYPDITHNYSSQYPVPRWDLAYAMTLQRESYNPRPKAEKHIHNIFANDAVGSISYSEGINDDVNKFVWSDQDWDPDRSVSETLRDYANLFISSAHADDIAQALLALEKNWEGPLLTNSSVTSTLLQWQALERNLPPSGLGNYRFQMGLLRAYYDAYIQQRLIREIAIEKTSKNALSTVEEVGIDHALDSALTILKETKTESVRPDWRARCFSLADSLFQSIGSQLMIEKHHAKSGRGNFMDFIDRPLNDYGFLLNKYTELSASSTDEEKLKGIQTLLNRTNPGPGGFYDNFGDPQSWKRVVHADRWHSDPGNVSSPTIDFGVSLKGIDKEATPLAWRSQVTTHYNTPLQIKYEDLDSNVSYKIRISYTGRFHSKVKLTANDRYLIHDYLQTGGSRAEYEFLIPPKAIKEGKVEFSWRGEDGGRGPQVAEIWLIKKQ